MISLRKMKFLKKKNGINNGNVEAEFVLKNIKIITAHIRITKLLRDPVHRKQSSQKC